MSCPEPRVWPFSRGWGQAVSHLCSLLILRPTDTGPVAGRKLGPSQDCLKPYQLQWPLGMAGVQGCFSHDPYTKTGWWGRSTILENYRRRILSWMLKLALSVLPHWSIQCRLNRPKDLALLNPISSTCTA